MEKVLSLSLPPFLSPSRLFFLSEMEMITIKGHFIVEWSFALALNFFMLPHFFFNLADKYAKLKIEFHNIGCTTIMAL